MIDICCAIVILAIVDGRWGGRHLFQLKPFVMLGLISYGVYLWHLPILFAIQYYGPHWNDVVKVIVAVTATLGVSIASWFLVERPFMRMKSSSASRWINRRQRWPRRGATNRLTGRPHVSAAEG